MTHQEDQLQTACIRWWDYAHPGIYWALFHVPNGGKRNVKEDARFKAMGVRAGVPDLLLILPRQGFSFLAIELKAGKNTQTERQKFYEQAIEGFSKGKYAVVRSLDDFIATVEGYLNQSGESPRPVGSHD